MSVSREEDTRKFRADDFVRFISLEGEELFGTIGGIVHMPDMDIFHVDGFYTINVEVKGVSSLKSEGTEIYSVRGDAFDYMEGHAEIPEENITLHSEWIRENKIKQVLGE